MISQIVSDAEIGLIASQAFMDYNANLGGVLVCRKVVAKGLPFVRPELYQENFKMIEGVLNEPISRYVYAIKHNEFPSKGTYEKSAEINTQHALDMTNGAVDAAALIFVHSCLESLVFEYCKAWAFKYPLAWLEYRGINREKVTYKELLENTTQELIQAAVKDDFISKNGFRRATCIERIEALLAKAPPPLGFEILGVKIDMETFKAIDSARHPLVHNVNLANRVEKIDEWLNYLTYVPFIFVQMLHNVGIYINTIVRPKTG